MRRLLSNWRILGTVGVVVAILAAALWPDSVEVDLARAERRPLQVTVDEEGETRVRERFVVSAPVAGRLQRIELEPGDQVVRGETVLAHLNPAQPTLLDTRTQAEHSLHPLTAFVWKHADGRTPVAQIADRVRAALGGDVTNDHVWAAIDVLTGAGLIENRVAPPAGIERFGRRDLLRQVAAGRLLLPGDDDQDGLRRGDIVARRRILHVHDIEELAQEIGLGQQCEASTHGVVIALCL